MRPAARAATALAEIDFNEGRPLDAVDRLKSALETLRHEEADEDVALVTAQLGRFLVLAGRTDEGNPCLEQALALSEAFDLPEIFIDALISKSLSLSAAGRLA